ncbi:MULTISPECIES: Gfo/Idh/MocA family protein [unclassified Novosphingobium]|uniref:Gfo/Idh/MocA family protein n=1 Tax=unclassified Novosphingobium TaxID=2644732 RepID=UPI00135AD5C1|nr:MULTISPECIES: Gfo/Idh/MocA family oxidoreductase [unclassified Novosphingobium]
MDVAEGKIGVGIVGANPDASWAAMAHVPALQALDEYHIAAVSTTRMETARAAGAAFGVANVYDNHAALIADPAVDLVVVAVKVPFHHEIATAALAAGKHVYCEWPLGHGLAQSEEMAEAQRSSGARGFIGNQAAAAPAFRYLRDLLAQDYVGKVQSVSLVASGMAWGAYVDQANAYSLDEKIGATMLTIPFGHTMAALDMVLGLPVEVSARIEYLRREATVVETGETLPLTAPDQVLVQGIYDGGAPLSVHFRGGMSRGTNLLLEINGTEGDIQVTGLCGHVQMFPVALAGGRGDAQALEPLPVPDSYLDGVALEEGVARNVAYAYRSVARDIRGATGEFRSFEDALRIHRVIDAVERAARSGGREAV